MTKTQMLSALRAAGVRAEWYGCDHVDNHGTDGSFNPDAGEAVMVCSASGWPALPDEVSFKVVLNKGHWFIETWAPFRYHVNSAGDVPRVAALLFAGAVPGDRAPWRLPESLCRAHGLREIAPLG